MWDFFGDMCGTSGETALETCVGQRMGLGWRCLGAAGTSGLEMCGRRAFGIGLEMCGRQQAGPTLEMWGNSRFDLVRDVSGGAFVTGLEMC